MSRFACRAALVALFAAALLGSVGSVDAQKPPPPVKPNPQAPTITGVTPTGVQRGKTIEVVLTGANLANPTGVLASFPGTLTIPTDNKNGTLPTSLRVQLQVPADAPLGYHTLRLATTKGMSNFRLFCVDDLPPVAATGTNRSLTTAQPLQLPCVVSGQLAVEQGDYYKITVTAGQHLSFDVLGRRLGSAIDPQISIFHAQTKRELAHENDSPGCQNDPRLAYTFKDAGDYLIEVKDTTLRGGADYGYRLRVGDFPLVTTPMPLAVRRGTKVVVMFSGPHASRLAPINMTVPADPAVNTIWVAPKGPSGLHGWPVALLVSDHEELLEREENDTPAQAQRLQVPCGVTGQFRSASKPGTPVRPDVDYYIFGAKKGQKLLIEAHTLELYSPSLVFMSLKNAKTGAELGKTNAQAAPPLDQRIEFTATDDGDYLVEVQHLNYLVGPSEVYRLTVTPSDPGYDVTLGIDRYDVSAGGILPLPLLVNRRGYVGPIEVKVVGGTGLKGQVTIPAGQPPQPNLIGATLLLNVSRETKPGPQLIALECTATINGKVVTQYVNLRALVSQTLGGLPFPPRNLSPEIALAITEAVPFELKAEVAKLTLTPGGKEKLKVTVVRHGKYDGPIAVELKNLPANVTATKGVLAKGQAGIELEVTANAKAAPGEFAGVTVGGTATGMNNLQGASLPFVIAVNKAK